MRHVIALLIILAPLFVLGQTSSQERPQWADGYFRDLDKSYIETVSGNGQTLEQARTNAANEIIKRRDLATGAEVTVSHGDEITVRSRDNQLIVKSRIIDEYVTRRNGQYHVDLLVQTVKRPDNTHYEQVRVSNEYPFSARNLVPGAAQIYKGSKAKGIAIIAAEAAAVGVALYCENERSTYANKAIEQPKFSKEYTNKANNYQTARNVAIGAAAALWVYNVIDATVARGKKRVFVSGLSVVPYLDMRGFAGVSLACTF